MSESETKKVDPVAERAEAILRAAGWELHPGEIGTPNWKPGGHAKTPEMEEKDEKVEAEVLRLMGKHAKSWGITIKAKAGRGLEGSGILPEEGKE